MTSKLRVLAIAVRTGRVGYVFLIGGRLKDWRLTKVAAANPKLAQAQAETWIEMLRPDVVVTEDVPKQSTKCRKTRELIDAIARVAEEKKLLDARVLRVSLFKNKYEEAEALGKRFPEIAAWVPKKPKIWEKEPPNLIYFEALALALRVLHGPEPDYAVG